MFITKKINVFLFLFCLVLASCADKFNLPSPIETKDEVQEWLDSIEGKTSEIQIQMATKVWSDSKTSTRIRNRATYILASRFNPNANIALLSLENQYASNSVADKIKMEETLYTDLQSTTNADLTELLKMVKPEQEGIFPYSLLVYVAAKRNMLQNSQNIVATLTSSKYFQSPLLNGQPTQGTSSRSSGGAVAILLPRSGNIAPFSAQIIAGVEAARNHLSSQGINLEIHYIDTSNPNWIAQVQALPINCVTIGGPIQTANYNLLKENNLLTRFAVFTFLPRLTQDEGLLAWQFFTKPEDQINSVLNVSSGQLGINSFGIFAPDSSYGASMSELFTKLASDRGFYVETGYYSEDDIKSWSNLARDFLQSTVYNRSRIPTVNANFDAIFFPGPWRDMDQLISTMHYQGAHNKIMLGTLLWEQSLNQSQNINPQTFALSLFPVAYDPNLNTPLHAQFKNQLSQSGVGANDWSALGFDFLMMASQLNLTQRLTASEINMRLQNIYPHAVSAPFQWNNQGISQRLLFINQPSRSGRINFDANKFMKYRMSGGALPNQAQELVTKQTVQTNQEQENQAMEKVNDLIDNILAE